MPPSDHEQALVGACQLPSVALSEGDESLRVQTSIKCRSFWKWWKSARANKHQGSLLLKMMAHRNEHQVSLFEYAGDVSSSSVSISFSFHFHFDYCIFNFLFADFLKSIIPPPTYGGQSKYVKRGVRKADVCFSSVKYSVIIIIFFGECFQAFVDSTHCQ